MKRFTTIALLLVLAPSLAFAKKKPKKPVVPAIFKQAQYVYVEATDGDEFNPALYPPDREAIANVEQAIREWKRYVLTFDRRDADLVFVVRTGRLAGVRAGYSRGTIPGAQGGPVTGRQGRPVPVGGSTVGSATSAGGEVGPPDDLLEVCQFDSDGTLSTPLWIHTQHDGLDAPEVPLFEQLKNAVDRAYPQTQASQTKKP
jgi:hypothetical protein